MFDLVDTLVEVPTDVFEGIATDRILEGGQFFGKRFGALGV
jgi:hypothetical protein